MVSKGTQNPIDSHNASSVVVLVHGIRTHAGWMNEIEPTLRDAGFAVERTNYGRLDLLRFLLPIPALRKYPVRRVQTDVRTIRMKYPGPSEISFIAHSFGTYVVAEILRSEFDLKAHRVVFCGSVVHCRFPFEQITERFRSPVMNDVGTKDILPALAESSTWGYSSSGTHGFNRPNVQDRLHDGLAHSDFLQPMFCKKYWIPFLKDGTCVLPSDVSKKRRSWMLRLLLSLPIKYIGITLFAAVLLYTQLATSSLVTDIKNGTLKAYSSRAGTIEKAHETDFYRIEVTPEQPIVTIYSSGTIDTSGSLSTATDSGVSSPFLRDDDSGEAHNFRLEAALEPGTYYVGVTGSDPGEYVVHLNTYSAVELENRITATIAAPDDAHYFVTSVPDRSSVGLVIYGDIRSDVKLLRPTAEGSLTQVPIDEQSGLYNNLIPGKYYVRVRGFEEGDYEVHLTPYIIFSSSPIKRTTRGFSGVDVFRFSVNGERPYITIYTTGSLDTKGTVRLGGVIDPDDGMYLGHADDDNSGDDGNFRISTYLDEGEYLIEVRWRSKSENEEYSIHLTADRDDGRLETTADLGDGQLETTPLSDVLQAMPQFIGTLEESFEGTLDDGAIFKIEVPRTGRWVSIRHESTEDVFLTLVKAATDMTPGWKREIVEGAELVAIGTLNFRSARLSRVLAVGSYYVVLVGMGGDPTKYSVHAMLRDLPEDRHGSELADATSLTSTHKGLIHGDDVDYFWFVVTDDESWVRVRIVDNITDESLGAGRFTLGQLIFYEEGKGAFVVGQDLQNDRTQDLYLTESYWLPGLEDLGMSKVLKRGTYYIKIQSIAAAARLGTLQLGGSEYLETWPLDVGSYTIDLRIEDVPEDYHADDLDEATALADVAEGWIGGDDVDYFRFEVLDSESALDLQHTSTRGVMIDVSTSLRVKVTILSRTKVGETEEIASVEDDPAYGTSIETDLESGTYYVRVETFEPRGAGPYTIRLELGAAVGQPTEDALMGRDTE